MCIRDSTSITILILTIEIINSVSHIRGLLNLSNKASGSNTDVYKRQTQKIMGNISEATIAMDFTEIADGQRCGLA